MQGNKRDTDVKNRLLEYVGEGEGGMIWENSIETCIFPYIKEMTSASWMREAGHSELVLWDNPRDGGGRKVRAGFWMGEHMCTHGWFMSLYEKNTTIF